MKWGGNVWKPKWKKADKQARCRCESDYNVKKTRGIKKETDTVYRRHPTQVKPNSISWQQLRFFCENKYIGIEYKLLAYGKRFFKDL